MCGPVPAIIAGASLLIEVGSRVAEHEGQKKEAKANEAAAKKARRDEERALSIREIQEATASSRQRQNVARDAGLASGMAIAAAAEAGVQGGAVQALLKDIEASTGRAFQDITDQYVVTTDQLDLEREGAAAREASRIAGVPEPSLAATGLKIGGAVTNYLNTRSSMNRNRDIAEAADAEI